jgi:hypothetical protein
MAKYELVRIVDGATMSTEPDAIVPPGRYALVPPGRYALVPKEAETSILEIVDKPPGIIPSLKPSTSNTPLGTPPNKRPRSITPEILFPPDTNLTRDSFTLELYQRDNFCVVTRHLINLKPSHIIAKSWYDPKYYHQLPLHIREVLDDIGGIHSPRNGILLTETLSRALDTGMISFRYENDHYYLVSLVPEYSEYDGMMMYENDRPCPIGGDSAFTVWTAIGAPNPELMNYHLLNSIFKRMRGAGASDEEEQEEGEEQSEEFKLLALKEEVYEALGKTIVAEKIAESLS